VHPIDEIHVRISGRSVERLRASSAADGSVTRGIMLADVRFRLDNDSARESAIGSALENRAQQIARYSFGIAIVEIAPEYSRDLFRFRRGARSG
jgi:hypothetical protein